MFRLVLLLSLLPVLPDIDLTIQPQPKPEPVRLSEFRCKVCSAKTHIYDVATKTSYCPNHCPKHDWLNRWGKYECQTCGEWKD